MNTYQQTLTHYAHAYRQLYKRSPLELRMIENNCVIVNGARLHIDELEYLAIQLQKELDQQTRQRHGIMRRLMGMLAKH